FLDVGAAAKFARPIAEAHDAHDIAVLLLEEVHCSLRDRFPVRLLTFVKGKPGTDLFHHALVDAFQLLLADRAIQRYVKGRVIRTDPRAFLDHLVAQDLTKRLMEQMSCRVVPHDLPPARRINRGGRLLPGHDLARDHRAEMGEGAVQWLLCVLHADAATRRGDRAGVADLAAGLGVKRRALEKYLDPIALPRDLDERSILAQREDFGLGRQLAIAREL